MRILAIETSTKQGSLALLDQGHVVCDMLLPGDKRSASSLAPAMNELLDRADWKPDSIGVVAVANGPGSFTGLRIAVTAAKTYAYAVGAHLIAVNTLDVLAEQLPHNCVDGCAIMDAQRQQLFAARFLRADDGHWRRTHDCHIVPRDNLAALLSPATMLIGPILTRLGDSFLAGQPRADTNRWLPQAATVGSRAHRISAAGQFDDPFALQPQYYRASYAEEK